MLLITKGLSPLRTQSRTFILAELTACFSVIVPFPQQPFLSHSAIANLTFSLVSARFCRLYLLRGFAFGGGSGTVVIVFCSPCLASSAVGGNPVLDPLGS